MSVYEEDSQNAIIDLGGGADLPDMSSGGGA